VIVFILRRILSGILLIGVLTFLTFFVFNEIPTNPACLVVACGPHTTTTDAMIRAADHQLGIDRSVFVQYGDWVWHVVRGGDFGESWTAKQKVGGMLGGALPVTASLVLGGVALMLLLALPLGAIAATRPRTPADRGILAASVFGLAIHPFVLALFIRDFFGEHFHVFDFSYCPLFGSNPAGCGGPIDWAGHLAVPWVVFALFFLPLYMRMIRVRLLETYSEPYISTARAKGASERRVLQHHALRNAIGPLLPMLAIDAGTALTAAIYIETVFGLQGLGSLAVGALSGEAGGFDLPLVAGVVFVVGAFVVVLNVAADVAGAWVDPRIRQRSTSGLIPLPRSIDARPRVRLALNLAVGVALVALLAVAVANPGSGSGPGARLVPPVHTVKLAWDDVTRISGVIAPATKSSPTQMGSGYLETKVTAVEFGKAGWRVHASVADVGHVPVRVLPEAPAGAPVFYPRQPFSLIVQTDAGSGTKTLQPFAASSFDPPVPQMLKPGETWSGTFSGSDPVKKGALFYVGFGQFGYDPVYNPTLFSITSQKSGHAP
jgi:peptide/nickel transport system permease protein